MPQTDALAVGLPGRKRFPGYDVLGLRVDDAPPGDLVREMVRSMVARERLLVMHVNAWLLTLTRREPWLRDWFSRADVVYVDGTGAQWAANLLNRRKMHRSTAPDWFGDLGRLMAAHGASIFWLGSRPDVIEKAARDFGAATGARVAGWHHGYFDKSPDSPESLALVEEINRSGADFLVVNMGMPVQERWLRDNWDRLDVSVALVAGALAERMAGLVGRPPAWVSTFGLEWLTRLVVEPRRLWRRYLIGLPTFGWQIASEIAIHRRRRLAAVQQKRVHSGRDLT